MSASTVEGFSKAFQRAFGVAPPFSLPEKLYVERLDSFGGERLPVFVTSFPPYPLLLTQGDRKRFAETPVGFFQAGWWGHGMNSHAFYLCEVTRSRRVFLRLPFGNAYGNPAEEKAEVLRSLEQLAQTLARNPDAHVIFEKWMGIDRVELTPKTERPSAAGIL